MLATWSWWRSIYFGDCIIIRSLMETRLVPRCPHRARQIRMACIGNRPSVAGSTPASHSGPFFPRKAPLRTEPSGIQRDGCLVSCETRAARGTAGGGCGRRTRRCGGGVAPRGAWRQLPARLRTCPDIGDGGRRASARGRGRNGGVPIAVFCQAVFCRARQGGRGLKALRDVHLGSNGVRDAIA